jgi:hypothetical protein
MMNAETKKVNVSFRGSINASPFRNSMGSTLSSYEEVYQSLERMRSGMNPRLFYCTSQHLMLYESMPPLAIGDAHDRRQR